MYCASLSAAATPTRMLQIGAVGASNKALFGHLMALTTALRSYRQHSAETCIHTASASLPHINSII